MNKVRLYREQQKISQAALARSCNCSQPTISAIEDGGQTNVYLAQRIAAALSKSVEEVFSSDETQTDSNAA